MTTNLCENCATKTKKQFDKIIPHSSQVKALTEAAIIRIEQEKAKEILKSQKDCISKINTSANRGGKSALCDRMVVTTSGFETALKSKGYITTRMVNDDLVIEWK